jgi:hypothetical protein
VAALLAALGACTIAPPVALAPAAFAPKEQLPWRVLAPGLRHAVVEPWPQSRVHLVHVDLHEPSLRLRLSALGERGRTPEAFAGALAAEVVVNVSFFDRAYATRGHTVSEGQAWPGALEVANSPVFACDAAQRCNTWFDVPAAPLPQWFNAMAGTPWLVRSGQPRSATDDATCEAFCARPHPRTAWMPPGAGSGWLWWKGGAARWWARRWRRWRLIWPAWVWPMPSTWMVVAARCCCSRVPT